MLELDIQMMGLGICLFSIFLLLSRDKVKVSDGFSIAVLILWSVRFVLFYFKTHLDLDQYSWVIVADQNLFFLDGVLLYWLTKSINGEPLRLWKRLLHLLPFFIATIASVSLFFSMSSTDLVELYDEINNELNAKTFQPHLWEWVFIVALVLVNFLFLTMAIHKAREYNRAILQQYSDVGQIRAKWLQPVLLFCMLFLAIPLLLYFTNYLSPALDVGWMGRLLLLFFGITAIVFSAFAVRQSYAVLSSDKVIEKRQISEEQQQKLRAEFHQIQEHMGKFKPYLEANLSLGKLAAQVGLSPNQLSQIINTQTQGNFHDFINHYRIEGVKKALEESDEQVIIVAYANGFNSKSTFNEVFKKFTGFTPTQYRKRAGPKKSVRK